MGGPVYQFLRQAISNTKWNSRNMVRGLTWNWDMENQLHVMEPELEINPNRNMWRLYLDTGYYGGVADKFFEDFCRIVIPYMGMAWGIGVVIMRMNQNDKFGVIEKWRPKPEE